MRCVCDAKDGVHGIPEKDIAAHGNIINGLKKPALGENDIVSNQASWELGDVFKAAIKAVQALLRLFLGSIQALLRIY